MTLPAILAALALATPFPVSQEPITDLTGRQMRVVTGDGTVVTLRFAAEGVLNVSSPAGEETGQWALAENELCFIFPEEEPDCWPWKPEMPVGQPVAATNADGVSVLVTLE